MKRRNVKPPSRETYSFSKSPTLDYPTNRKGRAISIILFKDAVRAVSGVTDGTLGAVVVGSADVMGWFRAQSLEC